MGADGSQADVLCLPGGGCRVPPSHESLAAGLHYLRMDGKETYKNAVTAMTSAAQEALRRCDLTASQIKCIIPHQANLRIIEAVADRLKVRREQFFINLDKYGNTSAASVAIALDEAVHSKRIERGDLVLMVVFGGGFTWGAAVIEW
jgi:3-oxoacyl-[acyl-carrier-protein] synthase-3